MKTHGCWGKETEKDPLFLGYGQECMIGPELLGRREGQRTEQATAVVLRDTLHDRDVGEIRGAENACLSAPQTDKH